MALSNVFYHPKILDHNELVNLTKELKQLPWCIPPSGIPGNNPPRFVAALGDGSRIAGTHSKILYIKNKRYPKTVAYPAFQCAKSSSAMYNMRRIPLKLAKLIIKLRQLVKSSYGDLAIDIDKMFNVCVCNYYTENRHQIAAHKDDERWLRFNEKPASNDGSDASIIASLTIYPDQIPTKLRQFQIYNEKDSKWETFELEHNSILLFSNHQHRVKPVGKRGENSERINITFRTLAPGLLGLTGFSNFYRYMSIPYQINCINEKHRKHCQQFIQSAENANRYHNKKLFDTDIKILDVNGDRRKIEKKRLLDSLNETLPRYVKALCTIENIKNYLLP